MEFYLNVFECIITIVVIPMIFGLFLKDIFLVLIYSFKKFIKNSIEIIKKIPENEFIIILAGILSITIWIFIKYCEFVYCDTIRNNFQQSS